MAISVLCASIMLSLGIDRKPTISWKYAKDNRSKLSNNSRLILKLSQGDSNHQQHYGKQRKIFDYWDDKGFPSKNVLKCLNCFFKISFNKRPSQTVLISKFQKRILMSSSTPIQWGLVPRLPLQSKPVALCVKSVSTTL